MLRAFGLIVIVLGIPSIVFLVTGMVVGMPFAEALGAMLEQYGVDRPNLLVTGVIGLAPLALLGVVLWIHQLAKGKPGTRKYLLWGGFIPIVAVLIWSNQEFWGVYLPERRSPGFPHGLELLIGPIFYAPVAMGFGMVTAWFLGRKKGP